MKKSPLYTRTGDSGMTSLVDGTRVAKNSPRVSAYGELDELNANIGLLQSHCSMFDNFVPATLLRINNTLFNIGAYLATPSPLDSHSDSAPASEPDLPPMLSCLAAELSDLEQRIDLLDSSVEPMHSFILPGGCIAAGHAQVARTVCRRAERSILTLTDSGAFVHPAVLTYINRLSDYLFVLARYANRFTATPDIPWQK